MRIRAAPDERVREPSQGAQIIVETARELGNESWLAKCLNGTDYGLAKTKRPGVNRDALLV
jgi:hypothetical protein